MYRAGALLLPCCYSRGGTRSVPSRQGHRRKAEKCYGSNKDNAARTCKKLPVASFCASETAETGRIANGREQGDHVSRRRSGKGFNWVCAKFLFGCADSRFAKPRISFWEGFNFVSAKLLFGWVDSRFAKPQCSLQGERFYSFRLYEKNQKYPKGCGPLDSRGRFKSPLDT